MVTVYESGAALVAENRGYLDTNPYLAIFFYLDSRAMPHTDKVNFALMAESCGQRLLAIRLAPFSTVLFGDSGPAPELMEFLLNQDYQFGSLLGSETVCDEICRILREQFGIVYEEALAMDFMETDEVTEPSCDQVEPAVESDLEELLECQQNFLKDCGLEEDADLQRLRRQLDGIRVYRQNGHIASVAQIGQATEKAMKIAFVYTRPEYRGKGIARKVVNTAKNEILSRGMTATLNVDKKNPVTNHLYTSLGFRKVFSQGEYRRKEM